MVAKMVNSMLMEEAPQESSRTQAMRGDTQGPTGERRVTRAGW
jgi:hypothetical protein